MSPVTGSFDPDAMQIDSTEGKGTGPVHGAQKAKMQREEALTKDATVPGFLSWARDQPEAPIWIGDGRIRHSNIVHFGLRYHVVSNLKRARFPESNSLTRVFWSILSHRTFSLRAEHLDELAALWLQIPSPTPYIDMLDPSSAFQVAFYFHTYCDKETWQIQRVLNCFIWKPLFTPVGRIKEQKLLNKDKLQELKAAITDIQQINGRDSALLALQNTDMFLAKGLNDSYVNWVSEPKLPPTERSFLSMSFSNRLNIGGVFLDCIVNWNGTLQIVGDIERQLGPTIPNLERDMRDGHAMIAVRPSAWGQSCARFCLFVFSQDVHEDLRLICKHLDDAIDRYDFHGMETDHIEGSDWTILRGWQKAISNWV